MQNVLKQFVGKDSVSFEDRLTRSLTLLTVFYSLILAGLLFTSSAITYSAFSSRIDARFKHLPPPGVIASIEIRRGPTIEEVREDLIESLVFMNIILLLLAILASNGLARLTLRPLKRAYDEQSRFIADASHELRTPLAIMHIEFENELHDGISEKDKKKIESYLEEVNRMNKIVQDLLLLSKMENPQSKIEQTHINISSLVAGVCQRLQSFATSYSVVLDFKTENEKLSILGSEQITHAFTNLIQNAIIYNKPDGKVSVQILDKKNEIEILIKDTGIGMSSQDVSRIFDRFYRVDKSRARKSGGSGLGLSIAKHLIESMKGTISIESELEKGTTISVSFKKSM